LFFRESWLFFAIRPRSKRNPANFFAGYSSDHPFASENAFRDFVGRYRKAGIDEFVLGYALGIEDLQGGWMVSPDELERYANVVVDL
jgi:hypothetical protein